MRMAGVRVCLYLVVTVFLLVHTTEACSGRKVYNSTWGIITDGTGKYPASAHCEWLIEANETNRYISLKFVSMETECSYDYLFIYDGRSYDSPLLGSFSGKTLPDRLLASSGYMLIYFYSDRNYVLNGFYARYNVTLCPYNCSRHGVCMAKAPDGQAPAPHTCHCQEGWAGESCERELCPLQCGDHGTCEESENGEGLEARCVCEEGFVGNDCSLNVKDTGRGNQWYNIAPPGTGFKARTGHAGVFINDSLYVFGGFTLNTVLDELIRFSVAENRWIILTRTDPWPDARREHAVAQSGSHTFCMFGGILANGSHSNELWQYNVVENRWVQRAIGSNIKPTAVASHTLTYASFYPDNRWLYLFGGRTENGYFLSDIYNISVRDDSTWQWQVISPTTGKEHDRRLVGHSTVFVPSSNTLLVFGGFLPDNARFPKRTNSLHAFHLSDHSWTEIKYNAVDQTEAPKDRAFHSAVIMGNYMVVYGGNTHIHNEEEICYDTDIYFYHLSCHRWFNYHKLEPSFPRGSVTGPGPGRFSQVAVAAYGNVLLVSGGYKGSVLADLMAYTVMLPIAKNKFALERVESARLRFGGEEYPLDYIDYGRTSCDMHNKDQCREDIECVWCSILRLCIPRSQKKRCDVDVVGSVCPGICPALQDCRACIKFGDGGQYMPDTHYITEQAKCGWCVQEAQCQEQDKTSFNDVCPKCEGGGCESGGFLRDPYSCYVNDIPPGLHFLQYRFPPNFTQPDQVSIIRTASEQIKFEHEFDRENAEQGEFHVRLRGFLMPRDAKSSNRLPLQLWLVANGAKAQLYLSTDMSVNNSEPVAQLEQASYALKNATRSGGRLLLPREQESFYMQVDAQQHIAGRGMTQIVSTVKVEWTGDITDRTNVRQPIPVQYLQPYWGFEPCSGYSSCLACMTNSLCMWCNGDGKDASRGHCVHPEHGDSSLCSPSVLVPMECPVCSDHVFCTECTADPLCEWLVPDARCTRRGRYNDAIMETERCPLPCQQHSTCSSCVGDKNECAWCAEHSRCFAFVEYVPRYAYGGCTQWLDGLGNRSCADCTRHRTCTDCLADYQCGWCSNQYDPTIGLCTQGDFVGSSSGDECEDLVAEKHNISEAAMWSYGTCPDVEECLLDKHDCHANATCHNTPTAYTCECKRGFEGDGRTSCTRTCCEVCVHGVCSGGPDCKCMCNIGWTGERCDVDCGCHNHSMCEVATGQCDACQHWTTGTHCELCVAGSYGNATSAEAGGCRPCECNGHADEKQGFCDVESGECYCKDDTAGKHCDQCIDGYYGDPRNGSRCYLQCDERSILGSITSGALGSYRGRGVTPSSIYCLWILTVHPDLNNLRLLDVNPTITFTMQPDLHTQCSQDYVYVYDGIPSFLNASETSSTLLAAFCGYGMEQAVSVEAKSGYLTIYFEASNDEGLQKKGFNATYHVNTCPNECSGRRQCVDSKCVCRPGYAGVDCIIELCPYNCSEDRAHGHCDMDLGICVCASGYGGEGCRDAVGAGGNAAGVYVPLYDPVRLPPHAFHNTSSTQRTAHSLLSCDDQTLLMYGGYSLRGGALNDMWQFNPHQTTWSLIEPANDPPPPRYQHGMVCVPTVHAVYLYGGLVEQDGGDGADGGGGSREYTSNELWKFNLDSKRWSLVTLSQKPEEAQSGRSTQGSTSQKVGKSVLPALAGHTVTLVGETLLYVIGGMSLQKYYSEDVYIIDIATNTWSVMRTDVQASAIPSPQISGETAMGTKPTGLYGHSAVYHAWSDAIYVFGGYEYQTDKNVLSENLYALTVSNNMWSLLPPELNNNPGERFLHAAVVTDDYMMLIGGRTRSHHFSSSVMLYRFSCNHWINISPQAGTGMYGPGVPAVIGAAAAIVQGNIYIHGGYDSQAHGEMLRLQLPQDLCALFSSPAGAAPHACTQAMGCASCTVHDTNHTYCYANSGPRPAGCLVENTTVSIAAGVSCDLLRIEKRDCSQHTMCGDCLTHWPAHNGHKTVCNWCSNCPTGMCISADSAGGDCETQNACKRTQRVIPHRTSCVETLCQAATCHTCWSKNSCMWTRQFKRTSEVGRTLSLQAIYEWNCVMKSLLDATPYHIDSSPPNACPTPCHQHTNCSTCVHGNHGAEGGNQSCVWSTRLNQCMAPAMLPLLCSHGECGRVLTPLSPLLSAAAKAASLDQCALPCSVHTQCTLALASPACGWCAFGGLNGLGVSMEGGLMGPLHGTCDHSGVHLRSQPLPDVARNWTRQAIGYPVWAYSSCPLENECLNGHHTCDESENCTDLEHGYRCDCKPGYSRTPQGGRCEPVCTHGCANQGRCVEPDVCSCYFGYVGRNCTTECQCNKHSNCKSTEERGVCVQCHNHTQGAHCEYCEPLYVGNSVNGGQCESCRDFCNYHSDVCLSKSQYNLTFSYPSLPIDAQNITTWLKHGPRVKGDTVCILCSNNTMGERCEQCRDGYFRDPDLDPLKVPAHAACKPCQCNGHSNTCDNETGLQCQCTNHTHTPACDTKAGDKKCLQMQCTVCADNFTGTPVSSHQCYRQMSVDANYCFNAAIDGNCSSDPLPLLPGSTVFYHVQPKYRNVDIRIIVDVTRGGVELYFSRLDSSFVVDVDKKTGEHVLTIDKRYHTDVIMSESKRERRAAATAVNVDTPAADDNHTEVNDSESSSRKTFRVYNISAADQFVTFIKVRHPDTFVVVRDIEHRLVITLPYTIHNLEILRFFMVLRGAGDNTHGNIVFHQDQPHINLFVFFSVFFSCFFLFLAVCVLIWKSKQAVDTHRSRHRQRIQMEHMASRPFGSVLVLLAPLITPNCEEDEDKTDKSTEDSGDNIEVINTTSNMKLVEGVGAAAAAAVSVIDNGVDDEVVNIKEPIEHPISPTVIITGRRKSRPATSPTSITSLSSAASNPIPPPAPPAFHVCPIALEPMDDGIATIGTVLLQLPGGKDAPMHMALASALISRRMSFPHQASSIHHNREATTTLCSKPSHIYPSGTSTA